jgi:hypothetical protein
VSERIETEDEDRSSARGIGADRTAARTRRLSVDLDQDLHARVRMECARRGVFISDVVRVLLEREFPERHDRRW